MWIEKNKNSKGQVVSYKYVERYEDPHSKKLKRVSLTHLKNTQSVQKEMSKRLNELIEKKLEDPSESITFKELTEKWFNIYKRNVKASTLKNVQSRLNVLNHGLGHLKVNNLSITDINRFFLSELELKNKKYRTVANDKSVLVRVLNFGVRYGYAPDKNYNILIEIPEINMPKKNHEKYLELDEIQSLFEQLEELGLHEVGRMCKLQISTGMRYNEMVALDYKEDIDLANNIIHITKNFDHHNNVYTSPKTGENRSIHINDDTVKVIKEQIDYDKIKMLKYNLKRDNTLLFRQKNERPIHIRSTNRFLKQVNIPGKKLSTHIFRHTFITLYVQNNIDSKLIAKHVGHNSTKMIEDVYSHFTKQMDEDLQEAINNVKII